MIARGNLRPRFKTSASASKLDRPKASLDSVYAALRDAFADATADTQDGLRLAWKDKWLHVRPSGTEPIVRVIAEAATEKDARDLVDSVDKWLIDHICRIDVRLKEYVAES